MEVLVEFGDELEYLIIPARLRCCMESIIIGAGCI